MGRGLSELQKTILIIGHQQRGKGDDPHSSFGRGLADVTIQEVLREHLGHRRCGRKRRASAYASVSRAMRRLHDRGLITHHKHRGAELSPWGMYQAYRLTTGRQPTLLTVSRATADNVNAFNEERWQRRWAQILDSLATG